MDLIYLHGPPAAGKLTIAELLCARAKCTVFHNHLAIDLARPLFEFGTPAFWALVRELRLTCLRAASNTESTVVYTSCYDHPADLPLLEQIEAIVRGGGGSVKPVYLQCDRAELERRVVAATRVARGKLRTVEGLRTQLERWNCVAVPRDDCLVVETDGRSAEECADQIIRSLGLGDPPRQQRSIRPPG
jgi:hypothetical protein